MEKFRKANPNDAPAIAELLQFSMQEIVFDFIGKRDELVAISFLSELIAQPDNQYSFQNCWIYEIDEKIAGTFILYDAAKLDELRKPVLNLLKSKFDRDIQPENETEAGELYIDNVSIYPEFRGKGIGTEIFEYIIHEFADKHNQTLGLLVDLTNPRAQKLYESLGFKVMGQKQLMSENHNHLQYKKGN